MHVYSVLEAFLFSFWNYWSLGNQTRRKLELTQLKEVFQLEAINDHDIKPELKGRGRGASKEKPLFKLLHNFPSFYGKKQRDVVINCFIAPHTIAHISKLWEA